MQKPLQIFLAITALYGVAAPVMGQCPAILNCPAGNVVMCDNSNNENTFWNASPFTLYPELNTHDLPETSVELSLLINDNCPGVLSVQYTLYLDLDGDNVVESVLTSDSPPLQGKMLFDNIGNPGYSGTDTIAFDSRPVPDSMKYHFGLELVPGIGTMTAHVRWNTSVGPAININPRLPEGRHRIRWTVVKNGNTVTCDYTFRVKDCEPPMVSCKGNINAVIGANATVVVPATAFVQSVLDNIVPDSLLTYAVRRAGAGTGFPLSNTGHVLKTISFNCDDVGQHSVELWVRDLGGNTDSCLSSISISDPQNFCHPMIDPVVCSRTVYPNSDTISDATYLVQAWGQAGVPPVTIPTITLPGGCIQIPGLGDFPTSDQIVITPKKNVNPLNGVSTLDLVLINRHILGTQLFDKAWKYLAADANNSGSLTTFDIVELRKLILGIYDSLPNSQSWRFYTADCTLNQQNPYGSQCAGTYLFSPVFIPEKMDFMTFKVGDVNGTAVSDAFGATPEDRSPQRLVVSDRDLARGEIWDMPVYAAEPAEWLGFQGALQFDPALLEIQGIRPGALPGMDEQAFAQPQAGLITFSWFAPEALWVAPDEPLFTLRVRARSSLRLRDALHLDPERLSPESYSSGASVHPLTLEYLFANNPYPVSGALFPPLPNPTTGAARIALRLTAAATAMLEITDFTGRVLFQSKTSCSPGLQWIDIPTEALPVAGVYGWRVQAGAVNGGGKLVRE